MAVRAAREAGVCSLGTELPLTPPVILGAWLMSLSSTAPPPSGQWIRPSVHNHSGHFPEPDLLHSLTVKVSPPAVVSWNIPKSCWIPASGPTDTARPGACLQIDAAPRLPGPHALSTHLMPGGTPGHSRQACRGGWLGPLVPHSAASKSASHQVLPPFTESVLYSSMGRERHPCYSPHPTEAGRRTGG